MQVSWFQLLVSWADPNNFLVFYYNQIDFISGIANIIGKLFTGWFTDLTCVNSFLVKNIFICLTGVSIILLPFCTAYWMFAVVAAMFGFFSSFVILRTIVLVELLGLEKLTSAFGLLALFEGTGKIWNMI